MFLIRKKWILGKFILRSGIKFISYSKQLVIHNLLAISKIHFIRVYVWICVYVYIHNCYFNCICMTCNYFPLYLFSLLLCYCGFIYCLYQFFAQMSFGSTGRTINTLFFVLFLSSKKHMKEFKVLSRFRSPNFGK